MIEATYGLYRSAESGGLTAGRGERIISLERTVDGVVSIAPGGTGDLRIDAVDSRVRLARP